MLRLSKHVLDEMDARRIRRAYIEVVIERPDHVAPDPADPSLARSYRRIPEFGERVLRVVHRPDGISGDVFGATAHWDRGARR